MKYPSITKKILAEGVGSINPQSLPEHLRKEVFSEATVALFKENRYLESSNALGIAKNTELAIELTEYLVKSALFQVASLFVQHTENFDKVENLAYVCLESEYYQEATSLFKFLGKDEMLQFIRANQ